LIEEFTANKKAGAFPGFFIGRPMEKYKQLNFTKAYLTEITLSAHLPRDLPTTENTVEPHPNDLVED